MRTSVAGSPDGPPPPHCHRPIHLAGFTLLELLVVLVIAAIASAGVGFAMRDPIQTRLEREALRLTALFESARARSQVSGVAVRWRVTTVTTFTKDTTAGTAVAQGFVWDGLPPSVRADDELPRNWLDPDTVAHIPLQATATRPALPASQPDSLTLGPEPVIGPQSVTLTSRSQPDRRLSLRTDGIRPFVVTDAP